MDFSTAPALFIYVFVIFVLISFYVQRLRWRRRKRKGKKRLGLYPRAASLGNAFHSLQVMIEPKMEHVLEEKLKEDTEEEASGDPNSPDALLSRQLKRIRRGEEVDRLTIPLRRRRR